MAWRGACAEQARPLIFLQPQRKCSRLDSRSRSVALYGRLMPALTICTADAGVLLADIDLGALPPFDVCITREWKHALVRFSQGGCSLRSTFC